MSFTSEIKQEICENKLFKTKFAAAQLYGMLLFSANCESGKVSLHTEQFDAAKLFAYHLRKLAGISPQLSNKSGVMGSHEVYIVSVDDEKDLEKVFGLYGLNTPEPLNLRSKHFSCEEERSAFLSGVFLVCGNVTNPEKHYHFEFTSANLELANELAFLLTECGIEPKISQRKGQFVVYLKGSSNIEDIITMIGAPKATLSLIDTKMVKELRNNLNRVTNCEAANIEKTATAAMNHIKQITYIIEAGEFDSLTPELKELCLIRMENPEMSLLELGQSLSTPLSRSGVNHRLQRLSQFADKLRSEELG